MTYKAPKSTFTRNLKRGLGAVVIFELSACFASFVGFKTLFYNQDHRWFLYENYRYVLEAYYFPQSLTFPKAYQQRESDLNQWISEGKIKPEDI